MKANSMLILQLFQSLGDLIEKLPSSDAINVKEFITHGEWGLAYEILCSQLYEYDVEVSLEYYQKIASLGELMEVTPSTWSLLKELIKR